MQIESDQVMKDINEPDFEQVTNKLPAHVQKTFVWTIEPVNNLLPTNIEPIQPI
jgi:hypothetical protein